MFDVRPEMTSEWNRGPSARWGAEHRQGETGGGRPQGVSITRHTSPAPQEEQRGPVTEALGQTGVAGHPKGQSLLFSKPSLCGQVLREQQAWSCCGLNAVPPNPFPVGWCLEGALEVIRVRRGHESRAQDGIDALRSRDTRARSPPSTM